MEIQSLNITAKQIKSLEKKGVYTVEDMVRLLPRKYYDFRTPRQLCSIEDGEVCSIVGEVKDVRTGKHFVKLIMREQKDYVLFEVIWFNQMYLLNQLEFLVGKTIVVCGTVTTNTYTNIRQISSPIVYSENMADGLRIYPVYSKVQGIASQNFINLMESAIMLAENTETLPQKVLEEFGLPPINNMLRYLHMPKTTEEIKVAKRRLIFEELYAFATHLEKDKRTTQLKSEIVIKKRDVCDTFIRNFPYQLTEDQNKTITELVAKASTGNRINALIQGDVGCGKTVVAFILMVVLVENGYQSALMAPTSVLAEQHYKELCSYVEPLGYKVALLKSDTKASDKRKILNGIASGEYSFIVGTHSIIGDSVEYKNLGITVVDEEHKFGVAQREALAEKAMEGVHSITMSATPIPRTLALTIYGEAVDVYNIMTLPNGRQPIQTAVNNNPVAIYEFMLKQIQLGHQCYVVCPLIEDSGSDRLKDVATVDDTYTHISSYFLKYPQVSIGIITGKMKKKEISEEIEKFEKNEYQILISTTIVEVGVNIPNATVILIKDAERFGLSSLHQLRGRVGRGDAKSFCILQSADKNNPRLKVMCETTNGFKIAEEDLKLRGSGDFIGTRQSGENKQVMLMLAYPNMYRNIRNYVAQALDEKEVS